MWNTHAIHARANKTCDRCIHTKRAETQIKTQTPWNSRKLQYVGSICSGGVFQKYVFPEGLAKEPKQIMKLPECLNFIDYTMVLNIPTCKFDETKTDAFKHIPDLFGRVSN